MTVDVVVNITQHCLKIFAFKANEEDLTIEYREERDRLIERLRTTLKPKEKNGVFAS